MLLRIYYFWLFKNIFRSIFCYFK